MLLGVLCGPICVVFGVPEAVAAVRAGPHAVLGPSMTMGMVVVTVMTVGVMEVVMMMVVAMELMKLMTLIMIVIMVIVV